MLITVSIFSHLKKVNKTSTEVRVEAHVKELVKEVFDRRLIGKIVSDTGSHSVSTGTNTKRPELQAMIKSLRPDDCIVICKLDRLCRSLQDMFKTLEDQE